MARRTIDTVPAKLENFKAMAGFFEGEHPPENMTVILKPNESFTFEEAFEMKDEAKFTVNWKYSGTKGTRKERKVIIHDWASGFRLIYEFSFLPYVEDADLLDKMNIKWSRYGRLPLGANGTYTVTSELIKY